MEALIDADVEADKKWWNEVEAAIISDTTEMSCECNEPEVTGKKRELSLSRPDAKKMRRPG